MRARGCSEIGRRRLCVARVSLAAALACVGAAVAVAGCGSSGATTTSKSAAAPVGTVITGPGLQSGPGPWPPEYAHLVQRRRELGLPPVGNEKFHIHAALHIYKDGLLIPVPALIGLVPSKKIETALHTHDATGIIHMETIRPYKFTLGEFFKVWGVKLGPAQLGGLTGVGGDKLHFYVNGHKLEDPAAYVMHNGDNISIGYGADSSFPHSPGTQLLREVQAGKAGLNCSSTTTSKKAKSCMSQLRSKGTQKK
jgi:hypothetical protein